MSTAPRPFSVRPIVENPARTFPRAAFTLAQGFVISRSDPRTFLGEDAAAALIFERSVAGVGTIAGSGWAAELAQNAWREFLVSLEPTSAAARLMARAVPAIATSEYPLTYPVRLNSPSAPAWVGEGGGIPVGVNTFSAIAVGPSRKMAHILAWSRELGERSDAEAIFAQMLREDVAWGIDAGLFATTAASSSAPAGLLYGVSALAGYAGGDDAAMKADLAALAAVVATGGSGGITFVMAPARLAKLQIQAPALAAVLDIAPSAAVPANRVIAVDAASLIIGIDQVPDIVISNAAALHMSSVPLEIVDDAGTVADPVRSLWQTASAAARVIHEIAFSKRRAAAAAYLDGATW